MKIITSEEYLGHNYEDSVAFEIMEDGAVNLIAETEYNENEDEEDYTDYRINRYNWLCEWKLNGENGLIDMVLEERGSRCGGIYLINEEDAFKALLDYFPDNNYTVILCDNDEETKNLLPILAPGYYLITMPQVSDSDPQPVVLNKFYVLVGRYGVGFTLTFGSFDLKKVQEVMKTQYNDACDEEKDQGSYEDGVFGDMLALVMTSDEWHEWVIYELDLPESYGKRGDEND